MQLAPVICQRQHVLPPPSWASHPCPLARAASFVEPFLQQPIKPLEIKAYVTCLNDYAFTIHRIKILEELIFKDGPRVVDPDIDTALSSLFLLIHNHINNVLLLSKEHMNPTLNHIFPQISTISILTLSGKLVIYHRCRLIVKPFQMLQEKVIISQSETALKAQLLKFGFKKPKQQGCNYEHWK